MTSSPTPTVTHFLQQGHTYSSKVTHQAFKQMSLWWPFLSNHHTPPVRENNGEKEERNPQFEESLGKDRQHGKAHVAEVESLLIPS